MKKVLLMSLVALVTSACASVEEKLNRYAGSHKHVSSSAPYRTEHFHYHVGLLARQLFDTSNTLDTRLSVIVGTFFPVNALKPHSNPELNALGLQLQESFSTLATQAGLNIVEYKSMSGVKVSPEGDFMLTRDTSQLDQHLQAHYMLTGNYTKRENDLIVNVKLINIHDKTVVAAATGHVPHSSMFSRSKVQMNNGFLYHREY